jgi:hypothetical protein
MTKIIHYSNTKIYTHMNVPLLELEQLRMQRRKQRREQLGPSW